MGYELSQAVSSVSVLVLYYVVRSVGLCLFSATATTQQQRRRRRQQQQQQHDNNKNNKTNHDHEKPYDGRKEDADDDNETGQIEYWSFWR